MAEGNRGMSGSDDDVGYGRPPRSTRFKRGQSGNPRGRPRGRKVGIPHDAVLGQMVTIRENGKARRITAAEAFLLQLTKQGLEGDSVAARQSLAAIQEARAKRVIESQENQVDCIVLVPVSFNVNPALEPLRMARKLDRFRPTARMMLEPWIVEEALVRLGGRRLSPDQQRIVLQATRTPHKVNWPDWWTVRPE
ncbi:DUF5681 domain-containing protein [Marimonas sp. MJW-29]|uniref:DUF5681 domain-containing protein n=1 Tax=Sulfitobacter sediminis TaxID=3234186 RepID=A0ABV3RPQ8_9RHOB